jgi:hypothetical protein
MLVGGWPAAGLACFTLSHAVRDMGMPSGIMLSWYHVMARSSMWIIGALRVFLMFLGYYPVSRVLLAWSPNVLGIGI